MLLDNIMACAPLHINAHTAEPTADPESDAHSQPNSSQAPATHSQAPLQDSQQQHNAEPQTSQLSDDLALPAQADSTAAAGADCSARPLPVADTTSGSGNAGADTEAGFDDNSSSSSRNRSSQCPPDDKLRSITAAANAASCNSSGHSLNDDLHSKTAAARLGRSEAAGASVQQPIRVTQQPDQQDPSIFTQQSGSEQSKTSQAIQQLWQGPSQHQAAIQQAVEHWACRLEMSGAGKASKPRAKRHLSRRQRAHIRHAVEQQNQIDDAAGQPLDSVFPPAHSLLCLCVVLFEFMP